MRVYFTIFISILLAAISCIFLSGCNNTNNVKNDSVRSAKSDSEIVSINIHETGGEDGRNIEWKVYSQNDSFFCHIQIITKHTVNRFKVFLK